MVRIATFSDGNLRNQFSALNNTIYLVGGSVSSEAYMNYTYKYELNGAKQWQKISTLSPAAQDFACVVVHQSDIYVLVNSGELYRSDDGAQTWNKLSAKTIGGQGRSCTVLQKSKSILVAGGGNVAALFDEAELYDIETNTWKTIAHMAKRRILAKAVTIQGSDEGVVCGGMDQEPTPQLYHEDCEAYHVADDKWKTTEYKMNNGRIAFGLVVGKI